MFETEEETMLIKEVQALGRFLVDFDQDDDWESCAQRLKKVADKITTFMKKPQ